MPALQKLLARRDFMEEFKEKSQNELLLTAIYQNCQTALQSIDNIMPSVKSDALTRELTDEESEYNIISQECEMLARSEDINIKDNNMFEKIRLWSSIKMSTLTDKSTTHVAEMLLLGTFMGMIQCIKDLGDHPSADEEIVHLCKKLEELEEKNIENLKNYL